MSVYSERVSSVLGKWKFAKDMEIKLQKMEAQVSEMQAQHLVMLEAQQLLATVSDQTATAVLDYVTSIVNKTLGELFPHDSRKVHLERVLYRGQHAHIYIKLSGTGGRTRDLELQTGTGLRQVISFLFVLSLLEIRKGRRLLIMDEILSGLHPEAKRIIMEIITMFADDGFQFVMVEYGANKTGKIYLVEKPDAVATCTALDKDYNDEVFVFNRPPEDVDLSYREHEDEVVDVEVIGG